ncbi:DUF7144 family membrane protein [Saccharothrix sp. Mg75]|uniref:DUF7144 family membrane protein n=1 Tax=Saccharothrix sp. Mg75 TaxID=3445357 RepID=UPI003EEC9918
MDSTAAGTGTPTGDRGTATGHPGGAVGTGAAWAGWIAFAAVMTVLVGVFNTIFGLVALFAVEQYAVGPHGLLVFSLTTWGWVHLVVGVASVVAGVSLTGGAVWARGVVVLLVSVNAVAQVVFMPAHPLWSLVAVTLDVVVIWALVVHGNAAAKA